MAEKSKVDTAKRRIARHHAHAIQTSGKQKRGAKCASYVFTLCHTAEWYSRFTRVIFALRRVVLLRSGIRKMCERYSRTSCECRAAAGGLAEIMLFLSSFIKVIRNCHIQRRPKKHTVLFLPPFSPLPYIVRRRGKKQRLCI